LSIAELGYGCGAKGEVIFRVWRRARSPGRGRDFFQRPGEGGPFVRRRHRFDHVARRLYVFVPNNVRGIGGLM